MVLTTTEIEQILKDNPNGKYLELFRKESKVLTAHMTGHGNNDLLEKISGLENDDQLSLRKKFARSNKDIFARIHRPEDKIFTAKGGSKVYDISDSEKKKLITTLQNIYNGISIQSWVEQFALTNLHIDPMGVILIEINKDGTQAYPTYKSTSDIFDYKTKGRALEYIVLNTSKKDEYRVIDQVTDTTYKYSGGTLTVVDAFPNYFGEVPGLIISNILRQNSEYYTSPDAEIVELANEYLRESSVKTVYKLKHGYPKSWQYAGTCTECKGTGHFEGKDCKTCNGSGRAISKDASQTITIPIPEEGQPTIAPNIAGFVSPDIQGWDKMNEEQEYLETLMHSTYWGIKERVQFQGQKTATEIVSDMQPINDRLVKFSQWAEEVEKFITDKVAMFLYSPSYKGCSINYGKRFVLESYDQIWTKYQDARAKGSPMSVLDNLLIDYYESRYASNQIELSKHIKLMAVEPYVHQTPKEVKELEVSQLEYAKKVYYHEWIATLNPNDILLKDVLTLRKELTNFVQDKINTLV
jgi:hypothetical protein